MVIGGARSAMRNRPCEHPQPDEDLPGVASTTRYGVASSVHLAPPVGLPGTEDRRALRCPPDHRGPPYLGRARPASRWAVERAHQVRFRSPGDASGACRGSTRHGCSAQRPRPDTVRSFNRWANGQRASPSGASPWSAPPPLDTDRGAGWRGRTRTSSFLIQSQVPYQFGHSPAVPGGRTPIYPGSPPCLNAEWARAAVPPGARNRQAGRSSSESRWRGRSNVKCRRSRVASLGSPRRSTRANTAASTKPMSASA